MTETVPNWKFWHPLPFWQLIVIALVAQIVCILPVVALRELAGIHIPMAVANGLAGMGMVVAVRGFARRRLAAGK